MLRERNVGRCDSPIPEAVERFSNDLKGESLEGLNSGFERIFTFPEAAGAFAGIGLDAAWPGGVNVATGRGHSLL